MKLSPFSAWNAILFMYPPTHRFVSIYHRFALFFLPRQLMLPVGDSKKDLLMQPICWAGIEFVNRFLVALQLHHPPVPNLQTYHYALLNESRKLEIFMYALSRRRDIYAYDERIYEVTWMRRKAPFLRVSIFICLLFPDSVYLLNGFM